MKTTQNRLDIINALTNAGLGDFDNTEEMERAHQLLKMMLSSDAPKKRTRNKSYPAQQPVKTDEYKNG